MTIANINSLFHDVDLSLLRYFFDVATYGGYTKASQATGVSQPALSLGVQRLERALDMKLVTRGGRQFGLTEQGRELLQFCKRFESGLQALLENFGSKHRQIRILRIGTALSVGFDPLVSLCSQAAAERILEIEMVTQNTFDLLRAVSESDLDAALLPTDARDPELAFAPISQDQIIFVVGKKNATAITAPDWHRQTGRMNLITYPRESPMRSLVNELIRKKGLRFQRVFSVNSIEALKMLVSRGVGGAFILRSLALNELRTGVFFEPTRNLVRFKSGVVLATRKDAHGAEVARLLLEYLRTRPS